VSLSDHFATDAHDTLGFDPGCPICRQTRRLNSALIASGDPDLITPGTRLRLR